MTPKTLRSLLASPIAFHRVFATIAGGALPGLFLSQCFYWSDKTADPEGWFYKSRDEWEQETCLTRREQETARKPLRDLGILHEEQRGGRQRWVYFRLDLERLTELVEQACEVENPRFDRAETYRCTGTKRTDATARKRPMQWYKTYRSSYRDYNRDYFKEYKQRYKSA